jgi:hypothetical protein
MTVSIVDLLYLVIIICSITLTVSVVVSLGRLNVILGEFKKTSEHIANLTSTLDRLNQAVTPAVGNAVGAIKRFSAKAKQVVSDDPKPKAKKA